MSKTAINDKIGKDGSTEVVRWKRGANKRDRLRYHWQRQFGSKKDGSLPGDAGNRETYKRKGFYVLLVQLYHMYWTEIVLSYRGSLLRLLIKKKKHLYIVTESILIMKSWLNRKALPKICEKETNYISPSKQYLPT